MCIKTNSLYYSETMHKVYHAKTYYTLHKLHHSKTLKLKKQFNISFKNNPLYYSKTQYIIKNSIQSFRNILYHAKNTSFMNNHYIIHTLTISCINSPYHCTFTISFRHLLYYAKTTYFYML